MESSKGLLVALILIFSSFGVIGFTSKSRKEITLQERANVAQQEQSDKDMKSQEEKKPEEKKILPSEEAKQMYDYDEAEISKDSHRNLDRSINTLNVVATLMGVLVGLITVIIILAVALGIFEYRKYKAIIRRAKRGAEIIEGLQKKSEERVAAVGKQIKKVSIASLAEELSPELKERFDEYNRRLEFIEMLGLPLESEDYINRGYDLISKSKYEYAVDAFEKAINLESDNYRAWLGKGIALNKLRKDEEALKVSEKLIKLSPDEVSAWGNKGASLINLNRFEEALIASEEALKRIPSYARAWHNKGTALLGLKRYDESLEALMTATTLHPDYAETWYYLACLFSVYEDRENLLISLEKAVELNPKFKAKAIRDEDFKEYWEDEDFKRITC